MSGQTFIKPPNRTARPECQQKIEAENSRGQNQGECHDRFDEKLPAPPGGGQPGGQRQTANEKNQRGEAGQSERESYGVPVHASAFIRPAGKSRSVGERLCRLG